MLRACFTPKRRRMDRHFGAIQISNFAAVADAVRATAGSPYAEAMHRSDAPNAADRSSAYGAIDRGCIYWEDDFAWISSNAQRPGERGLITTYKCGEITKMAQFTGLRKRAGKIKIGLRHRTEFALCFKQFAAAPRARWTNSFRMLMVKAAKIKFGLPGLRAR